jgi:hypothetical protein
MVARRVVMGDDTDLIYTVWRVAEHFDRSEATVYRILRRPEAACFGPVPLPNGGARTMRGGQQNSLTALFARHDAEVSSLRAEVGRRGGLQRTADRSRGSSALQSSSGSV